MNCPSVKQSLPLGEIGQLSAAVVVSLALMHWSCWYFTQHFAIAPLAQCAKA